MRRGLLPLFLVLLLASARSGTSAPTDITPDPYVAAFRLLTTQLETGDVAHGQTALAQARKARTPALTAFLERWVAYDEPTMARELRVRAASTGVRKPLAERDRAGALKLLIAADPDVRAASPSPFAFSLLRTRAKIELSLGQFDAAVQSARRAEDEANALGWKLGAFRAALFSVKAFQARHEPQEGLKRVERARAYLDGMNRPHEQAQAWLEKATMHGLLGDLEQAERSIQNVVVNAIAADDGRLLGNAYMSQGAIYGKSGAWDRAVHASLQATEAFRSQKIWGGVAGAVSNSIIFLAELGRYGDALGHYEALRKELKREGASVSLTALLVNVGSIYLHIGLTQEAIAVESEALERARAEGNDQLVVQARGNLAIAHVHEKDYERALAIVTELLAPDIRDRFPEEAAISYAVRANCLRRLGRLEEAQKTIDEATARAETWGDLHQLSALDEERGDLALARGRPAEALEHFRRSAKRIQEMDARGLGEALAQTGIARALFDLKRYEAALSAAEQALAAYELFGGALGEHEAAGFRQEAHKSAEIGIVAAARWAEADPSMRQGAVDRAFALSELGRGRRVVAAIANPGALLSEHVAPELRLQETQSKQQVDHARHGLMAALRGKDRSAIEQARKALDQAWQARQDVVSRVQREATRVAALVYPRPVPRPTLQKHLADCCVLISYHFVPEHVYAFVVTKDHADLIPLGAATLLRDEVTRYVRLASTPDTDETKLATLLHEQLVKPLEPFLKNKTRLVIVADAESAFLPFGALIDGATKQRLIERFEVVAAPSATAYDALLAQRPHKAGTRLLAVGDPAYPPGGLFEPLPGSRAEVRAIAELFPEAERAALLGAEATPQALRDALPKGEARLRALHLACHARVDPRRPRLSGMVLSDGKMFDLDQVFRTRIAADLAVLSACDSARGKVLEGVGTQGFVRGFLFAGTPRVVVSNWRVADESTTALMRAFYKAMLKEHKTPSAALRQAQRAALSTPRTAHPYYWASFVLWGLPN